MTIKSKVLIETYGVKTEKSTVVTGWERYTDYRVYYKRHWLDLIGRFLHGEWKLAKVCKNLEEARDFLVKEREELLND